MKYFATLHGADKIIPFVVSGIPYSNDIETECIHEQIKAISQEELLAINVREEGIGSFAMKKKRAFIRVVARLLDIKFNTLWQPYERILRIVNGVQESELFYSYSFYSSCGTITGLKMNILLIMWIDGEYRKG